MKEILARIGGFSIVILSLYIIMKFFEYYNHSDEVGKMYKFEEDNED